MNGEAKNRTGFLTKVTWLLIYVAAGWVVGHFYLHYAETIGPPFEYFPQTEIGSMVDQTGQKPFVGRMLVPLLLKGMADVSTPQVRNLEGRFWSNAIDFAPDFIYGQGARPKRSVEAANIYYLSILIFVLIPFAVRMTYGVIYNDSGFRAGLAGLLMLITVPLWFSITSFFYDPMTILLSTLLVYCAAKARPWLGLLIFFLALLNKETAVLFIPVLVYGMYAKYATSKVKDDLYYTFLVGFATIAIAIMVQLYRINHFAANPGDWLEHHWADTAPLLFNKLLLEAIHAVVIAAIMLTFAFVDLKRKPLLLKVATVFVFIPIFITSIAFGRIIEIRAYYDAYPILGLLALPTLYKLIQLGESGSARVEASAT